MNRNRVTFIVIIMFFLIVIYSNGYYNRNIKVDDIFLETIVQSITKIENARVNKEKYTYDDYIYLRVEFDNGVIANKSNPEINIVLEVQAMSEYLFLYNDKLSSGLKINESEQMNKYFDALEEVQRLLEPYRERNDAIESLWTKNIFN